MLILQLRATSPLTEWSRHEVEGKWKRSNFTRAIGHYMTPGSDRKGQENNMAVEADVLEINNSFAQGFI